MEKRINVKLILDYIKENNLTRKEFCEQCDINLSTFYRIINNKNNKLIPMIKIAKK